MGIWELLMQVVNVPAMLAGVAATVAYNHFCPGVTDVKGSGTQNVFGGTIWSRLQPFVGPAVAFLATIGMEWYQIHPELGAKKGLLIADVVRGMTTALASEYCFRVYYKTIVGV
jgi:hypothetical protein